jgi:23S rRNA pseudouridine2605 synthase
MEERLQKLLAQAGFGSRRACEELIAQGRVTVNGRRATLGEKADPARAVVALDGEPLATPEHFTYILLHKPRGVVSSLEPQGERPTVRSLVPIEERVYPVGRLDLDSEGLILLTNDGRLTEVLTHPRYETEKEYRVLVRGEADQKQIEAWRRGVMIRDERSEKLVRTAPAQVWRDQTTASATWLRVVMHEGRKHEIREIGLAIGLPVQRLIRVRLGPLTLGVLKVGEWRHLTDDEVTQLRALTQASAKPRRAARPQRQPITRAARSEAPRLPTSRFDTPRSEPAPQSRTRRPGQRNSKPRP